MIASLRTRPMRACSGHALCALAMALLLHSLTATAQQRNLPAPAGASANLYREATELYEHGDFLTAEERFREALRLQDSPQTWLWIARCLREQGHAAEALVSFREAMVRAAERAVSDRRFTSVRDLAVEELREAETRVARIRFRLEGTPQELRLRVAGREVGPSDLSEALVVAAGAVLVRATAEGFEPFEQQLQLTGGTTTDLRIELRRRRPLDLPLLRAPASPFRIGGWVLVGTGAITLTASAALFFSTFDRYQSLTFRCAGRTCPENLQQEVVVGRALEWVSWACLATGLATTTVGTALLAAFGAPFRTLPLQANMQGIAYTGSF